MAGLAFDRACFGPRDGPGAHLLAGLVVAVWAALGAAAGEAFAREKLIGLLTDRLRAQIGAVHWTAWAVSAVMVGRPIVYLISRR